MANSELNEEKTIRNKFTILSFICSILVICIHNFNLETYGIVEGADGIAAVTYAVETYWSKVLRIAVSVFFFISGILFFRTFEIKNLLTKWKSRLLSVGLPYVIWCSLYYLYYVLCTNTPFIKAMLNGKNVVELSFSEWINWLWVNEYYVFWFLQSLIVFIILTPLIWALLKNHKPAIPTGFIALVAVLWLKNYYNISWKYIQGIEIYLIGSYIGLNCRKWLFYKNKVLSVVAAVYIVFILATAFRFWNFFIEVFFYLAMWFVLDLFKSIQNMKAPWWMSIVFFTYVAHDVFLEAFKKIIFKVGGPNPLYALLGYIMLPLIVEALLIGIAYVMKNKLPRIWKVLTGNRANAC